VRLLRLDVQDSPRAVRALPTVGKRRLRERVGQGSTDRAACGAARVSIFNPALLSGRRGSLACRQRTAQGLPTASPHTDRTLIIETWRRIHSPTLVCILTLPPAFSARKASGLASYTRRRWERGLAHQPPYMQVLWKSATCRCSMPHQPHVDAAAGVSRYHTCPDPSVPLARCFAHANIV